MASKPGRRSTARWWLLLLLITSAVSLISVPAAAQSRRFGGSGITLFTNPNYRGESVTFRNDTPDLRAYELNDKISSIEMMSGDVWEICQDINYGNRCRVLSDSVTDLRDIGWNDRISSLRHVGNFRDQRSSGTFSPGLSQRLVFYDRSGYRGASTVVTGQTSNLGSIGSGGNREGSVEVRGGTWELCDRNGRCATVSENVPDLSRLGLGRITSARPFNNQGYGRSRGSARAQRDRYYGR